mgnify:CR=1 FL=1
MLTLWRPRRDLVRWNRPFDDFFNWGIDGGPRARNYTPAVDIEEKADAFLLRADLPGIDENAIDVKVEDGVLVLSGTREASREEEEKGYRYRERRCGAFSRQFRLGDSVDAEKIQAKYEKGVLTVELPKKEAIKPKQIPVISN